MRHVLKLTIVSMVNWAAFTGCSLTASDSAGEKLGHKINAVAINESPVTADDSCSFCQSHQLLTADGEAAITDIAVDGHGGAVTVGTIGYSQRARWADRNLELAAQHSTSLYSRLDTNGREISGYSVPYSLRRIVADHDGNSWALGTYFDLSGHRKSILYHASDDLTRHWTQDGTYNRFDDSEFLTLSAIATSQNRVWVAGTYRGTPSFAGVTLRSLGTDTGLFVAKLDAFSGQLYQVETMFLAEHLQVSDMAVGPTGNLTIVGRFAGWAEAQNDGQFLSHQTGIRAKSTSLDPKHLVLRVSGSQQLYNLGPSFKAWSGAHPISGDFQSKVWVDESDESWVTVSMSTRHNSVDGHVIQKGTSLLQMNSSLTLHRVVALSDVDVTKISGSNSGVIVSSMFEERTSIDSKSWEPQSTRDALFLEIDRSGRLVGARQLSAANTRSTLDAFATWSSASQSLWVGGSFVGSMRFPMTALPTEVSHTSGFVLRQLGNL